MKFKYIRVRPNVNKPDLWYDNCWVFESEEDDKIRISECIKIDPTCDPVALDDECLNKVTHFRMLEDLFA